VEVRSCYAHFLNPSKPPPQPARRWSDPSSWLPLGRCAWQTHELTSVIGACLFCVYLLLRAITPCWLFSGRVRQVPLPWKFLDPALKINPSSWLPLRRGLDLAEAVQPCRCRCRGACLV